MYTFTTLHNTRITGIFKQIINFGYIFVVRYGRDVGDVMFEMDRS